jgi:hypothetical protein
MLFRTEANVMKLLTAVSYEFLYYAGAFVPGKPFQPSQMFAGKAEAYPSEAPFRFLAFKKSLIEV